MRLRQRLFMAFLILSAFPMATTFLISVPLTQVALENEVLDQLSAIANIHETRAMELIGDYQERINHFAHHDLSEHMLAYQANSSVDIQALALSDLTQSMEITEGVDDIFILNTSGFVIAAINESILGFDYSAEGFFQEGQNENVLDLFYLHDEAKLHTHLTGPITANNTVLGVIVIDSDVYDLVDLFKDYTGLGWSGEALLARKDGNGDANFITPLRHHPESPPLGVTLPKESESAPITYALQGVEDIFSDALDYDGIPVLAATKYIPELGWGIVVKIYVSEVMASIQDSTTTMIVTSFLSAGLFLIIGLVILRSLTEPMTKLTDVAIKISDGDFSQRAEVKSDDEVSILAQSFNMMADTLINMNIELEKRVLERTAELARSNSDLEQFAYVISHDLQEPLRMIVSYLQLIETRYRDKIDDEVNEFIDFAVDGAKRMKDMINGLLMYSRVGRRLGPTESIELMGIVGSVLANLRMMMDEANAVVEYENLPSILANRAHMNMLFQNLISNAIKFRNEEPPIVRIEARHDGEYWIFSVSDNGIGIDSSFHDRLFKVFQRLHPIGKYEGSGIGLAICKRVVENLGGKIWLESELNVGTTFYFSIPEGVITQ